jgi:cellulose biosynthesis protein BcsQ
MGRKIIGVIQLKGGAERSTVSTDLAGELSKVGKTVLIDCDMPQDKAGELAEKGANHADAFKEAFQDGRNPSSVA